MCKRFSLAFVCQSCHLELHHCRQQNAVLMERVAALSRSHRAVEPPSHDTPFTRHVALTRENLSLRKQVGSLRSEREVLLDAVVSAGVGPATQPSAR